MKAALSRLHAEDRDIILQRNHEGLSWSEIASTISKGEARTVGPEAARKRYNRAMDRLKNLLASNPPCG